MVSGAGGKLKRGGDVVVLQIGIIAKDFLPRRAAGQHVENIFDAHAQPADAGPTAALIWIDRDALQKVRHGLTRKCRWRQAVVRNAPLPMGLFAELTGQVQRTTKSMSRK